MKNIIIFYEILSREYFACQKIKIFLEQKFKYRVKIYSVIYEYTAAIDYAKKYGVDCIIMPWLRLKENYKDMVPFLNINPEIVLCDFSHEQIASEETDKLYIPNTPETKTKVYHFCWGNYFKNLLMENGILEKQSIVTGNVRLDFKYEIQKDKTALAEKYELDEKKKWILFAEARDWVIDEYNFYVRLSQGLDEQLEKESLEWNKKYLKEIYRQLNELDDKFFEKYELIYRPHPSCSNPSEITNKNVKITADYSIYEWLGNVDYYISSASTSAFEAESIGLPVVCFELKDMPKTFKTYGLDEYYQISNLNELNEDLFKKAKEFVNNKNVYEKYIGLSDGKNCERVADVVNELLNEEQKIKHELFEFDKKQLKVRRIKEKIKKILIGTGLIRLIKSKQWCKLAYKDCPFRKENKKMYGIK